jgi:hypothetical protein
MIPHTPSQIKNIGFERLILQGVPFTTCAAKAAVVSMAAMDFQMMTPAQRQRRAIRKRSIFLSRSKKVFDDQNNTYKDQNYEK